MRVGSSEDDGGRGERGGGLAGEVGARVVLVHAVRLPRRRHVLGPLPAVVVRVAVPHLRAHRSVMQARGSIESESRSLWPLSFASRQ
jgi:hypothetical protein